jgi:hypothetical protein
MKVFENNRIMDHHAGKITNMVYVKSLYCQFDSFLCATSQVLVSLNFFFRIPENFHAHGNIFSCAWKKKSLRIYFGEALEENSKAYGKAFAKIVSLCICVVFANGFLQTKLRLNTINQVDLHLSAEVESRFGKVPKRQYGRIGSDN